MHATNLRAARLAARILVLPAALAGLAATAPQAAAHTELEGSSPGADASLAGPPPRMTLTFSDTMTEKYAQVAVTGPGGASAAQGEPQVSGKTVTLTLDPAAPVGRYTVGYRVVSADGHPVSGSYRFSVRKSAVVEEDSSVAPRNEAASSAPPESRKESAEAASSPPTGSRKESAEAAPTTPPDRSSPVTVPALAGAGALVVIAAVAVHVTRRKRVRHGD
ncbi:copper resistance protein CopC [Streptomyces chartreusis]|uniref:copper resistance CopC family protein n=1 Tax=Streptomyces chartreusis TaxID=1969 RepID=UPI00369F2D0A